jgi:hypothetical protein
MFKESSLADENCQPLTVYCGYKASLNLNSVNLDNFKSLNFKDCNSFFCYEVKICKFAADLFSSDKNNHFAYLVQVYVESDNSFENPFADANVFLEKDFEDLVEYSIILPSLFKRHHRYVIDMELDKVCSFRAFGEKINSWKKSNGLF